jgi:hypothetical protein
MEDVTASFIGNSSLLIILLGNLLTKYTIVTKKIASRRLVFQCILGPLIGGTNLTFPSQSLNGTTADSLRSRVNFTGYIPAVWFSMLLKLYGYRLCFFTEAQI